MDKILLDTSVFIDYQRAGAGSYIQLLQLSQLQMSKLYTSSVVVMEFWAGKSLENQKAIEFANDIFRGIEIIDLDSNIAKKAGAMIRKGEIHVGFDAVIAATCLEIGAKLATLNKRHFKDVPGLQMFETQKI